MKSLEGHANHHFDGELNHLHLLMIEMGALVLNQCQIALQSLLKQDPTVAQDVMDMEQEIVALAKKSDDKLIELIGKHSPISVDLRITLAFCKTCTDLKRVGDEAVRIAHITMNLYDGTRQEPGAYQLRDIKTMGKLASQYLDQALKSFDTLNGEEAKKLLVCRQEMNEEFQSSLRRLATFVLEDARNVGYIVSATLVVKALERIGEYAQNLAEYVIFLDKGDKIHTR